MKAKKLQVILLCCFAFVCFFIMSGNVKAAEVASGECGKGVFWSYDDNGTLTIRGEGEMDDYNENVINDPFIYTPWYEYKEKITKVVIEDGITRIGNAAFLQCFNLEEVTLSNDLIEIGNHAFEDSNLKQISFPDSLTKIGVGAFLGCWQLSNIKLPEKIFMDTYAFMYCELKEIYISKDTAMNWPVFMSNSLEQIQVSPDNTEYSSENGVLYNKDKTRLLCYPAMKADTTFSIPNSVKDIEEHAFRGNKYLENISIPNTVSYLGEGAFVGTDFESIVIPDSVIAFNGAYLFSENHNLKEVKLPGFLTKIPIGMFSGCEGLEVFTVPDGITSIGAEAFAECTNLNKIVIPSSVTEIEEEGYYGDLAYLDGAFYDCGNLTIYGYTGSYAETYAKENNIPFVSLDGTLSGGDIDDDPVPETPATSPSEEAPTQVNSPSPAGDVIPAVGESIVDIGSNAVYRITGNTNGNLTVEYTKPSVQTAKVTIPSAVTIQSKSYQVTAIANKAFKNNKKIKKITIPSTVTKIGKQAFFKCKKLNKIVIKTKKLKNSSVGKKAFKGISAKAVINVPKAKKAVYQKILRKKGLSKYLQIK